MPRLAPAGRPAIPPSLTSSASATPPRYGAILLLPSRSPSLLPGAVTPPTGHGALPPLPATDRWMLRRSRAGPTSPVVKAAPGAPRRTAFGDLTPEVTAIHGAAGLRRLQAVHQPRRSLHSTASPRAAASSALVRGTGPQRAETPSVVSDAGARGTANMTAPDAASPSPQRSPPLSKRRRPLLHPRRLRRRLHPLRRRRLH
jgi:hypothetical protein